MGDCFGCELQTTFRFTSPQAAMESSLIVLNAWRVGRIWDFMMPCNWIVCLVVILITPVLIFFALMLVGHFIFSYVPFREIGDESMKFYRTLDANFPLMVLAGFIAQLVDGALGMGYGVTSTTILLSSGVNLASISGSIHTAEMFASGDIDQFAKRTGILPDFPACFRVIHSNENNIVICSITKVIGAFHDLKVGRNIYEVEYALLDCSGNNSDLA